MVSVLLVVTEVVQTPHGQKHVTLHLNVACREVQTEETSVLMDTLVDSVLLNGGSVQDSVTAPNTNKTVSACCWSKRSSTS